MKQIRLKGETRIVTVCRYCPMGHRESFGLYCRLDRRTVFGGEKMPEWCPLEDLE